MNKEQLDKILTEHSEWLSTDGASGERADLRWANLRWANLSGAKLSGADLTGADLWNCAGNRKNIKSIFVSEDYAIVYTSEYMQIGCERHLISEWAEFGDARIIEMDGKRTLKFWREWRDIIFMLIEKSPAEPAGYVEEEK